MRATRVTRFSQNSRIYEPTSIPCRPLFYVNISGASNVPARVVTAKFVELTSFTFVQRVSTHYLFDQIACITLFYFPIGLMNVWSIDLEEEEEEEEGATDFKDRRYA